MSAQGYGSKTAPAQGWCTAVNNDGRFSHWTDHLVMLPNDLCKILNAVQRVQHRQEQSKFPRSASVVTDSPRWELPQLVWRSEAKSCRSLHASGWGGVSDRFRRHTDRIGGNFGGKLPLLHYATPRNVTAALPPVSHLEGAALRERQWDTASRRIRDVNANPNRLGCASRSGVRICAGAFSTYLLASAALPSPSSRTR